MKIICTTGPESSGKTSLAQALAERLRTKWTAEYAREYLSALERPYLEQDLLYMARGQQDRINEQKINAQSPFLVCDTDLLVIRIWSEVRYGRCHPWIVQQLRERPADLYLLCRPDISWQFDPLRENPHDREELFGKYQKVLEKEGFNYVLVEGEERAKRLHQAFSAIQEQFGSL